MASVISPAETDASKESTIKRSYQVIYNTVTENVLKDSSGEIQMRKRKRLFVKNNRLLDITRGDNRLLDLTRGDH